MQEGRNAWVSPLPGDTFTDAVANEDRERRRFVSHAAIESRRSRLRHRHPDRRPFSVSLPGRSERPARVGAFRTGRHQQLGHGLVGTALLGRTLDFGLTEYDPVQSAPPSARPRHPGCTCSSTRCAASRSAPRKSQRAAGFAGPSVSRVGEGGPALPACAPAPCATAAVSLSAALRTGKAISAVSASAFSPAGFGPSAPRLAFAAAVSRSASNDRAGETSVAPGLYSWPSKTAEPASHASADVRNRLDDCRTLLPSSSS